MTRTITVPAIVDSLHDGDTIYVRADLGWDLTVFVRVRILGINAPELSTPAGKVARDAALALLPAGTPVTLTSVGWDKYGGRTDGSLTLPDGRDFGQIMLAAGNAVVYNV